MTEEVEKPDLGDFYKILKENSESFEPALSFLSRDWEDTDKWKTKARQKVNDLLGFHPRKAVALNSSIDSTTEEEGVVTEAISYDLPYGPRTRGYFLYPENRGSEKLPGFLALHDHGGYYYYGKEKLVKTSIRSESLEKFRSSHYGGRSWANELALRGFAVLVIDVTFWGSRKILPNSMDPELTRGIFDGLIEGSDDYIERFNRYWDSTESSITISTILNAGACWPGIHLFEDRRSVDYLLTRPEVDPRRIGCGGLSMGGQRTIFLAGLDPRIKFALCVGFMSTIKSMLRNHIRGHGIGFFVPGLVRLLDLPDVMSLHAPLPLLVQYNNHDRLFSLDGQKAANRKLADVYAKMGFCENYSGQFYDGRHKFDVEMQERAFGWLEAQSGI